MAAAQALMKGNTINVNLFTFKRSKEPYWVDGDVPDQICTPAELAFKP
jgi:hypothetical protein